MTERTEHLTRMHTHLGALVAATVHGIEREGLTHEWAKVAHHLTLLTQAFGQELNRQLDEDVEA